MLSDSRDFWKKESEIDLLFRWLMNFFLDNKGFVFQAYVCCLVLMKKDKFEI